MIDLPAPTDTKMPPANRCTVCNGRGAIRCDCWPGDCICGFDDDPCDNCEGTGWLDPYYDDYGDQDTPPATAASGIAPRHPATSIGE